MPFLRFLAALCLGLAVLVTLPSTARAQHEARRVLWFNGMPELPPAFMSHHRETMARYVDGFGDGARFDVTYTRDTRGGGLATALRGGGYDIVVVDAAQRRSSLNRADVAALQDFYASGRRALMLDGSFAIRNIDNNPTTAFPGLNGSSAGLLMNQMFALSKAGGGILIGTDHNDWQPNANTALQAIVPGARFRGTTNPSTDGDFIGDSLLAERVIVTARDLLKHWESVPNQGEAPVGQFTDFTGQPITLHSLVETADKPGGGRKRPYISASFSGGENRIPIDSGDRAFENMPTHKSAP